MVCFLIDDLSIKIRMRRRCRRVRSQSIRTILCSLVQLQLGACPSAQQRPQSLFRSNIVPKGAQLAANFGQQSLPWAQLATPIWWPMQQQLSAQVELHMGSTRETLQAPHEIQTWHGISMFLHRFLLLIALRVFNGRDALAKGSQVAEHDLGPCITWLTCGVHLDWFGPNVSPTWPSGSNLGTSWAPHSAIWAQVGAHGGNLGPLARTGPSWSQLVWVRRKKGPSWLVFGTTHAKDGQVWFPLCPIHWVRAMLVAKRPEYYKMEMFHIYINLPESSTSMQ